MRSHLFGLKAACAAATAFSIACSGGGDSGVTGATLPPPRDTVRPAPVDSTVSLALNVRASVDTAAYPDVSIVIDAKGTNSAGLPVSIECTLDGVSVQCGAVRGTVNVTHNVCVTGRVGNTTGTQTCQSVAVQLPKFEGSLYVPTLNDEFIPSGTWIVVEKTDSTQVDAQGKLSLASKFAFMQKANICIRGNSQVQGGCWDFPAKYFTNLVLIGTPIEFEAGWGTFKGRMIPIDLVKATKRVPEPSVMSFFGDPDNRDVDGMTRYPVGSWLKYPLCVAFSPASDDGVTQAATSADSSEFWQRFNPVEANFGMDLAKSCSMNEVQSSVGLKVSMEPSLVSSTGGVTATDQGTLSGNFIRASFRIKRDGLTSTFVIQHDMLHVLFGMGHTCEWNSIMRSSCPRYFQDGVYAEDVAYSLLKMRTRELERKYNTLLSLAFLVQSKK